jgi:hypothetical protein
MQNCSWMLQNAPYWPRAERNWVAQSIHPFIHPYILRSAHQFIHSFVHSLFHWLVHWFADSHYSLIHWSIDIDSLVRGESRIQTPIHQLYHKPSCFHRTNHQSPKIPLEPRRRVSRLVVAVVVHPHRIGQDPEGLLHSLHQLRAQARFRKLRLDDVGIEPSIYVDYIWVFLSIT